MSGKPALKLVYSAPARRVKFGWHDFHGDHGNPDEVILRKEVCGTIAKGVHYYSITTYNHNWWSFMGRRPKVIGHINPPHLEVGTGRLVPDGPPEDNDWAEERVEWQLPPGWRGHLVLQ